MPLVWLIDDNPAFRKATGLALSMQPQPYEFKPFESCESAIDALKRKETPPEVILLDVGLRGMDGITGIKEFKQLAPDASILILTVFDDDEKIVKAICAGAAGYLLKGETFENIGAAIEEAIAGGSPMNRQVARRVLSIFSKCVPVKTDYGLGKREQEILTRMVGGLSKKEIATSLDVSVHTVNTFVRLIYKKLHVNCQTAAVSVAVREGLVDR